MFSTLCQSFYQEKLAYLGLNFEFKLNLNNKSSVNFSLLVRLCL